MIKIFKIKQSRGMTLMELMISMTMLSIILAFATGLFVMQQRSSSRQQKRMQLVQRGRGTMQLLTYRFREINVLNMAAAESLRYLDADNVPFSFYRSANSLWMVDTTHAFPGQLVANECSRFICVYRQQDGTVLAPPLSAANRLLVRQIDLTLVFRSAVPMYSAYPESLTGFISLRNM
jgi:prepilin-type N-terminal cleavage/methylation domain-containing protein